MTGLTDQDAEQRADPPGVTVEIAQLIRHVAIVGIAGLSLGLIVVGAGGRVLMRVAAIVAPDRVTGVITENGNAIGDVTVGGTINILLLGMIFGGIGAVGYVMSERWLSWTGPLRPLAFALLALVVAAPFALESDNVDFLLVENQELVVGMFVTIFLVYATLLPLLARALEGRLPQVDRARPTSSVAIYLSLVGFGVIFVFLIVLTTLGGDNIAMLLFLGTGFATLLHWAHEYSSFARDPWPVVARILGYGSLIGAATVGTFQTWNTIADILAGDFF